MPYNNSFLKSSQIEIASGSGKACAGTITRIHYSVIADGSASSLLPGWFNEGLSGDITIDKAPAGLVSGYSISDLPSQGGGSLPGPNGTPKGVIKVYKTGPY